MNIGVIVGRFQSPYLTDGHKALLKEAYQNSDEVAIFLLNNTIPFSDSNPLPFDLRQALLLNYVTREYKDKKTTFYSLPDQKYKSTLMFSIDQALITAYTNMVKFTMYGGPRSLAATYCGIAEVKLIEDNFHSNRSKDARNEAYDTQAFNVDFLKGVIHALNYRRVVCHNYIVSVLLHQDEDGETYCIAREDSKLKRHVFPTESVVSTYDTYEEQSKASMEQMFKGAIISSGSHIVSMKVDDWRFGNTSDFAYYHLVVHRVYKPNLSIQWVKMPFPLAVTAFEDEYADILKHINALRP